MVVPCGQAETVQTLVKVVRSEDGFDYTELRDVRFVPLLEGVNRD
jgi:protein-L-isoaspartate(D-aspartate) O-methyltransferase